MGQPSAFAAARRVMPGAAPGPIRGARAPGFSIVQSPGRIGKLRRENA
jgi:hypothetical protein